MKYVERGPFHLNGDVHLLKRDFTNLIINAVVHNSPGTEMIVSKRKKVQVEAEIEYDGKGDILFKINVLTYRYFSI